MATSSCPRVATGDVWPRMSHVVLSSCGHGRAPPTRSTTSKRSFFSSDPSLLDRGPSNSCTGLCCSPAARRRFDGRRRDPLDGDARGFSRTRAPARGPTGSPWSLTSDASNPSAPPPLDLLCCRSGEEREEKGENCRDARNFGRMRARREAHGDTVELVSASWRRERARQFETRRQDRQRSQTAEAERGVQTADGHATSNRGDGLAESRTELQGVETVCFVSSAEEEESERPCTKGKEDKIGFAGAGRCERQKREARGICLSLLLMCVCQVGNRRK
ncbi:hypothetical protein PR202_ga00442 [Eleusine coracana subsp. coracana]|uniref:Uncharacterized protein n=1 Tax=Eleusine coracana subsp. coracana TaxID=191504 RepID=A0AAV5BFS5_ELECO|nr:hypothetical protein PR202_ga00442 [Eleusine coracana subsp. coracana]